MFGKTKGNGAMRYNAYSLAEVLVVMAIIMIIFLALPPVTKKVFKINDAQRAHGRFECFWDVDENGQKALFSYFSEENDNEPILKKMTGNYCEFTPTANTLYYMIHAVGGGGAGAVIATQKDEDGNVTVDENLTPKNTKVQAVSYLSKSAVSAWPKWVTWYNNTNTCRDIPWCTGTNSNGEKEYKNQFDVNTISDKQQIRYRLGGSAGKVVSSFVPQLPGSLTVKIYPGKGGTISRTNDGSGSNGNATIINYVYGSKSIEALKAAGGSGGRGDLDNKLAFTLVGGKPTDFMISTKAAVAKKLSGFSDIIESSEKNVRMRSKVPTNAGDGGSGETQFVKNTAGQILYEYDDNGGVWDYSRRYNSNWKNLTEKVRTSYYSSSDNTSTKDNGCGDEPETIKSIEVKREGYCDIDDKATTRTPNTSVYICGIGKMSENIVSDILNASSPYRTNYTWQKFRVSYNEIYKRAEIVPMSSSSRTDYYDYSVSYSDDYWLNRYYTNKETKYYSCEFDPDYINITCKTKLENIKIHNCTTTSTETKCSNHEQAMCSNGSTYSNCSDASKLKCPAHNGGDGAVVILW